MTIGREIDVFIPSKRGEIWFVFTWSWDLPSTISRAV